VSAPDFSTPQMRCPTCGKTVRITKKGTVAQHTRTVTERFRWTSREVRCPQSFQPAPDGAYAAWLRSKLDAELVQATRFRALAEDARTAAAAHDDGARKHATRADEVAAALTAIGATP
jgi:hypothetical protein